MLRQLRCGTMRALIIDTLFHDCIVTIILSLQLGPANSESTGNPGIRIVFYQDNIDKGILSG